MNENCVNEVKIVSRCLTLLFCWPWLRLVPIEQLYLPLQISRGTVDLTNQHARNIHAMHYKFPIQTHDSQPSRFCSRRFLVNPVSKTHAFGHKIDTRCPTPCRCLWCSYPRIFDRCHLPSKRAWKVFYVILKMLMSFLRRKTVRCQLSNVGNESECFVTAQIFTNKNS